jgi:glycosyltransferase involved in cell wall biosynthesis
MKPSVVVVTPVRNEAWIIERFLRAAGQFADLIVLADQRSSDATVAIASRHPKVHIIENRGEGISDVDRQRLLISAARDLVRGPRVLVALDADEFLTASSPTTAGWATMLRSEPGTVVCWEKPDLLPGLEHCLRYNLPWPMAYVDDDREHLGPRLHSVRIPMPPSTSRLYSHDVKVVHLAFVRPRARLAKLRLYAIEENVWGITKSGTKRRQRYSSAIIWTNTGREEPIPAEWLDGLERQGVSLRTFAEYRYHWQDYEILRYMARYGARRFWRDPIWHMDWEECRQCAIAAGEPGMPLEPIARPSRSFLRALSVWDAIYARARSARNRLAGESFFQSWA